MKAIELLSFNKELLEKIHATGIKPCDCCYVELYNEYQTLKNAGDKVTYIVNYLSEKYGVSERKIYNIVAAMGREVVIA